MKITKRGRCATCKKPTKEIREFLQTVDMFRPTLTTTLTPAITGKIQEWRQLKMYCGAHQHER